MKIGLYCFLPGCNSNDLNKELKKVMGPMPESHAFLFSFSQVFCKVSKFGRKFFWKKHEETDAKNLRLM